MNQRDLTALPWADLDPGSGGAVIVRFPQRAPRRTAPIAVERFQDSIQALRTACAELSAMLEGLSASARSLERSCRSFDERLQAIGAYRGRIADSGGALTAAIKRFRKRLVAAVLAVD